MGRVRWLVSSFSALPLLTVLGSCAAPPGSGLPGDPPGDEPLDFVGTSWTLTSLNAQPPLAGTTITLAFEDGTFRGNSGCNLYGGDYTVTETGLEFSEMTLTVMACEPPIMAQEEAYVYALIPAATHRIEEGRLELVNRDNGETLSFAKVQP